MIITSTIRDTFEYFAKFPDHEGVMKMFNQSTSSYFEEEYPAFRTKIENLVEHSLVSGIQDFVFGVNEKQVIKRIQRIEGFYLFVDYGSISVEQNELKVKTQSLMLAITVAISRDPESLDDIEALIYSDQALDYIRQISARMISDQKEGCGLLKHLTFPNEITPFFARELQNSSGWTLLFSREGVGLIE